MTFIHPDIGWLLHMARSTTRGAVLYRDLIEINPPLVIWLLFPIVRVSELTGASLETVFLVAVGSLAAGSIVCSLWLLDLDERWSALPLLVLVDFVVPARDFGQREHLLLLLLTPYLCLAVRRVRGGTVATGTSLLIGLAAAIGFALKPHFGLIWIGTAAYLVHHLGFRRFLLLPETVTAVLAAPAYLLAITLFTPDYWAVLQRFGPLYKAFVPRRLWILLLQPTAMAGLLGAGLWAVARWRTKREGLRDVLAIAAAGAVVGALAQGKGFPYHYLPALALSILLAISLMGLWRPLTLTAGLLLVISGQVVYERITVGWRDFNRDTSPPAHFEAMVESIMRPGDRIAVLMWRLRDPWPVALHLGDAWTYGMPSLWWMRALYPIEPGESGQPAFRVGSAMGSTERYLFDLTVNDVLENRPRILVMPRGSGTRGDQVIPDREFDVVQYFSQDRRMEQLFTDYQLEAEYGRLAVWKRKDQPASTDSRGLPRSPNGPPTQ